MEGQTERSLGELLVVHATQLLHTLQQLQQVSPKALEVGTDTHRLS